MKTVSTTQIYENVSCKICYRYLFDLGEMNVWLNKNNQIHIYVHVNFVAIFMNSIKILLVLN
jgi:hypothetical protein